ncbi:hypothetical protein [Helicobacter trogontum]|nr:hypothetical protein [Helicobacter trogontum]
MTHKYHLDENDKLHDGLLDDKFLNGKLLFTPSKKITQHNKSSSNKTYM